MPEVVHSVPEVAYCGLSEKVSCHTRLFMNVHSPKVPEAGELPERLALVLLHISCTGPTVATGARSTHSVFVSETLAQGELPVAVRVRVTVVFASAAPGV